MPANRESRELSSSSDQEHDAELNDLSALLRGLDPLLIATGLAIASLTPGPAGQAAAIAAVVYDVSQKRWWGVVLSALSIIPFVGYVPAFLKVGLLLALLGRRLKALEMLCPAVHAYPEAVFMLRDSLRKYYRQIPDVRLVRRLRTRLARIMALDTPDRTDLPASPGEAPE